MHLLLEEFRISLMSSSSQQSVCHIISPTVGVASLILGPESESRFLGPKSEPGVLNFLISESESKSHKGLHIPDNYNSGDNVCVVLLNLSLSRFTL